MATFETAELGSIVFSPIHGNGEVDLIVEDSLYPLEVRFRDGTRKRFNFYGHPDGSQEQAIFWDEIVVDLSTVPVRIVNGIKIPALSYTPPRGKAFYAPMPTKPKLYDLFWNTGTNEDQHLIAHNLSYPKTEEGRLAAIAHAEAMLSI
jgi:hypothetical protein